MFNTRIDYVTGESPTSIHAADLDGDTYYDLAVTNWNSQNISILFNNGNGTFQPSIEYGAGQHPRAVCSQDFDEDGDNDLAISKVSF
jgi:hypothetical protein